MWRRTSGPSAPGLTVRQVVTAVLAFLSLYLTVSLKVVPFAGKLGIPEGYMLPLPPAVAPENNMRLFLIVNLVLVVLAAIVCSNIVGGGIAALCRMRANCDTPAALAVLAVLIQGIVLTVLPDAVLGNGNVSLYFPLAVVVLLFSLFGKKLMMKRIERNFATLTAEGDKYALVQIQNREFAREFSRGLGPDVDRSPTAPAPASSPGSSTAAIPPTTASPSPTSPRPSASGARWWWGSRASS